MALIEVYHVVADMYNVNPTFTEIKEGMAVVLDDNGYVALPSSKDGVLGVAGDSTSTAGATEWSANVTISANGAQRMTENRVSNQGNETLASGKMTVYTVGGKFRTDQYDTTKEYTYGCTLYAGTTGLITSNSASSVKVIGVCVEPPAAFPSGVPGTTVNGSMSLGNFLTFILAPQV